MNISNLERKIEEINSLLSLVVNDGGQTFFSKTNVIRPDFDNKELSFVRLVSYLYTIYFETGKAGISVLQKSMRNEAEDNLKKHKAIVQILRTKLQHNLEKSVSRDFKIELDCMSWTKSACGNNIAKNEEDWLNCSKKLVSDAEIIMSTIASTLEEMTNSPANKEAFVINWGITSTKEIPSHLYDNHINEHVKFIAVSDFDIVKYRNKNLATWRNYITSLNPCADFQIEIKKIVESSLVRDFFYVLPVTIDDLNGTFFLSRELLNDIYTYIHSKFDLKNLEKTFILEQLKLEFKASLK
ncbi:hypothetical protein AB6D34_11415 [Pectobacterium brasiliense]|uniref:Uncharacterized protein n=1 Tax=Pectobacterium brasiliense TaxID=180957 RepID=A0A433NDA9_9GAMM|nr:MULTISPECIES: hypothetical protein [Pectobacterium]GKW29259.1 hypothetical protein PEC331060_24370 [Pectobacterium carotovorum subsp. carotovorum]MBN3047087.1 hypothetical protein [Pectobacterium brasiliense]MBN3076015.1 hypothetical protein [Pectobacterium brasiliense]MBN3085786.1 hypothetical protein [Pectobacterium brasiliense]MBN3090136.1 hypothetical protein [Pectobacterium brasiliense]